MRHANRKELRCSDRSGDCCSPRRSLGRAALRAPSQLLRTCTASRRYCNAASFRTTQARIRLTRRPPPQPTAVPSPVSFLVTWATLRSRLATAASRLPCNARARRTARPDARALTRRPPVPCARRRLVQLLALQDSEPPTVRDPTLPRPRDHDAPVRHICRSAVALGANDQLGLPAPTPQDRHDRTPLLLMILSFGGAVIGPTRLYREKMYRELDVRIFLWSRNRATKVTSRTRPF